MKAFGPMTAPCLETADLTEEILSIETPQDGKYDHLSWSWADLAFIYKRPKGRSKGRLAIVALEIAEEGEYIEIVNWLDKCEIEFDGRRFPYSDLTNIVVGCPEDAESKDRREFLAKRLTEMTPKQAAEFDFRLYFNGEDITNFLVRPKYVVASRHERMGFR